LRRHCSEADAFLYHSFWGLLLKMDLPKTRCASVLIAVVCIAGQAAKTQSTPASANVSIETEFQAAMAAQDQGDMDRAQHLLSALHAHHPDVFEINESLGLILAGRENYAQALPLLEAAVRQRPDSDVAHANLGAALYKVHHNQQAAAELERAATLNPANVVAQQSLGQVLLEEHKPALAATAFSAAVRLKPGDDDLALSYAAALIAAGQCDRASQVLSSVTTAGQSALAQSLLGEIDENGKKFESAEQHFSRAVELDPSEDNLWELGVEFLRHWTFDAATRVFQDASARFPQSMRLRLGRGVALFGNAKYAQAIPVFADLLRSAPDNGEYAGMLGTSCSAVMLEPHPRCATLVQYAQSHPKDARATSSAAAFLLRQSDAHSQRPLVKKLLEAAIAADPSLAEAQFQMGTFLQDDGMWKESIPYLERAVQLKPNFSKAHYRLALACWRTDRKQEAQTEMELEEKFSQQEQEDLDHRLRQITTFVVNIHQ
jgi:predicted Zn-dependent protease